jgi:CsoR family transcriptional regulator, copper-sensing transcriptional repressor
VTAAPVAGECIPPAGHATLHRTARGYATGKPDYLTRLRKIEGQIRGLQKMIESDPWCPDVVTQVRSVTRALQEVAVGLVTDHLRHCVASAVRTSDAEG